MSYPIMASGTEIYGGQLENQTMVAVMAVRGVIQIIEPDTANSVHAICIEVLDPSELKPQEAKKLINKGDISLVNIVNGEFKDLYLYAERYQQCCIEIFSRAVFYNSGKYCLLSREIKVYELDQNMFSHYSNQVFNDSSAFHSSQVKKTKKSCIVQ